MLFTADARAQALAKLEEAIGRSEQALTRQLIAIAALERRGQDARHAHELLRVAEDHLTAAHYCPRAAAWTADPG